MCSLPFSILSKQDENILPLLTIQEHQKFCKSLIKSYQSYEKRKSEEKTDINKYNLEDELFQTQKKQNQEDILKWFENLTEYQKIKICTIKNKWLVNILIQLYLNYKTYDPCYFKPTLEMEDLFQAQKNFSHGGEDSKYGLNDFDNYQKKFDHKGYNCFEIFFSTQYPNNNYKRFSKEESEKKEKEKKFITKIKLISLDENIVDTLTLSKDILINSKEIKELLKFFSKDKCFQDWLLPIKINNIYNFVLPNWMHNNPNLTFFEIIIGYIEQQILLNYEYFYYSKKFYEYSYNNTIIGLYEENKKLVSFIKENYSFHNNNDDFNKKEFISLMEIREIVADMKKSNNYEQKIANIQEIYNNAYDNEFIPENLLNIDFKQIYEDLYKESMDGGELGIMKVIEHITFMEFKDIVNARDNLYIALRKKIVENQYESLLNELTSEKTFSENTNKKKNKNKKKKKKKNNKNNKNESSNNNIKNKEDIKEKNNDNNSTNENNKKDSDKNNSDIKNKNNINDAKGLIINEFNDENIENKNNEQNNIYNINNIMNDNNITIINSKDENINDLNNNTLFNNKYKKETNNEKIIIEENNSIKKKKIKNKDFFLYPIKNKKTNKKKKKLHSLSLKKKKEKKEEINIEDKKDSKNKSPILSPTIKMNNQKDSNNYTFNVKNINLKIENQISNFYQPKSPSLLKAEHQSFSFYKKVDDSIKNTDINNTKNISISTNTSEDIKEKDIIDNMTNNNIDNDNNNINNTNKFNNINDDNNFNIYYSNVPLMSSSYTPYTPSEKFFDSLTKEINNYISFTNNNITNLIPIHLKYLSEVENLIKTKLESKYEIKFGHYGSHFTNLSIEGSDLDILINFKSKNMDNDFFKDILSILNENENKFDLIKPILTASVPVIKLQININNEINDIKLNSMPYFEDDTELQKINLDLTFTQNEQEFQHSNQIVSYINQTLITFPIIKSLLLILKRYFKIMKMNKSFHGGLSSYSLYLLIYTFCKKYPIAISSSGKALYSFLAFFSFFEFHKYSIDAENINIYYLNNNFISNNFNYNFEDEIIKKEINIIDPLTKLNVAKSSFKVEEIQNTFRSAYDFLRTEGCYYDYALLVNKTGYESDYFNHIKTNYEFDNNNDFKTIKKLFALNKKHFFFDFFGN